MVPVTLSIEREPRCNLMPTEVVPAPMREDPTGNAQPLDRAWTTPKPRVANVVPAPMREDTTRNNQPLDRAWTTPKPRVAKLVPAPRLELGTP